MTTTNTKFKTATEVLAFAATLPGITVVGGKYQAKAPTDLFNLYGSRGFEIAAGGLSTGRRNAFTIIPYGATEEEAKAKILALIARATKDHESVVAAEKIAEAARIRGKAAEEAAVADWRGKLRVARGGKPDEQLTDETRFRILSDYQLLEARTAYPLSIRVPLPTDLDARAAFLAKLETFLAANL